MPFVELLRSGDFWRHRGRFRFSLREMGVRFVLAKGWFDLQKNLQSFRCGGGGECRLSNFYDRAIFGVIVAVSVFR